MNTKVNIFSYYLLLLDVNKIPDRYLMHMVKITNYENGRSRDVVRSNLCQYLASLRINLHQSVSISTNQWQCANVTANKQENLCIYVLNSQNYVYWHISHLQSHSRRSNVVFMLQLGTWYAAFRCALFWVLLMCTFFGTFFS